MEAKTMEAVNSERTLKQKQNKWITYVYVHHIHEANALRSAVSGAAHAGLELQQPQLPQGGNHVRLRSMENQH